jgi:hypothetical protein
VYFKLASPENLAHSLEAASNHSYIRTLHPRSAVRAFLESFPAGTACRIAGIFSSTGLSQ